MSLVSDQEIEDSQCCSRGSARVKIETVTYIIVGEKRIKLLIL